MVRILKFLWNGEFSSFMDKIFVDYRSSYCIELYCRTKISRLKFLWDRFGSIKVIKNHVHSIFSYVIMKDSTTNYCIMHSTYITIT